MAVRHPGPGAVRTNVEFVCGVLDTPRFRGNVHAMFACAPLGRVSAPHSRAEVRAGLIRTNARDIGLRTRDNATEPGHAPERHDRF